MGRRLTERHRNQLPKTRPPMRLRRAESGGGVVHTLLHHCQNMISPTLLGPKYGHKIAATVHFPKYVEILSFGLAISNSIERARQECSTYEFVNLSLVCMATMKYFHVTRLEDINQVIERYKAGALRGLQETIESCEAANGDAIVAASILMMEAAQS